MTDMTNRTNTTRSASMASGVDETLTAEPRDGFRGMRARGRSTGCSTGSWTSHASALRLVAVTAAVVLSAGLVAGVTPQSGPAFGASDGRSAGRAPSATPERTLFDIRFTGGSAQAFVDTVVTESGYLNMVVSDPAALAALQLPPITLERVTLSTAIGVLEAMRFRDTDGVQRVVEAHWIQPGMTLRDASSSAGSKSGSVAGPATLDGAANGACVLRVSDARTQESPDAIIVDLARRGIATPEEARMVIDALSKLVTGGNPSATFRITVHDESGLMAVHGTAVERQLAEQIIGQVASRHRGENVVAVATEVEAQASSAVDSSNSAKAMRAVEEDIKTLPDLSVVDLSTYSKSELQALLGRLSRARQVPTISPELKARLARDFNLVLARVKEFN